MMLIITLTNCRDKDDDKAWLWGLAWLSQSSSTGETATVEVKGTAKDSDGNVISNGTVSVAETTSSSIQSRATVTSSTTTDDSGNFTLNLKVAYFKITISKSDGTEVGTFELDIQNLTDKHVTPTNTTGLIISLTSATSTGDGTDILADSSSSTCSSCSGTSITRDWGTFTDMCDGTIKLVINAGTYGGNTYSAKTLYFAKCSHGQTYDSSCNTCTGTATQVQYCDSADNSCNGGTDAGTLNGSGTSGAYSACSGSSLASKSWRVPTKDELKLLINCNTATEMPNDGSGNSCSDSTAPTINNLFPNTQSNAYWSSSGVSGFSNYAWVVVFVNGSSGNGIKSNVFYVRCVSE